ncbi:DUF2085 domain-containing protein [Clostridium sp. CX1]|uniref:DUF2085 domain-containing protein n=1 Tax=Clostridium sp. CX1 TaxID=2978346 RepID=UPI0021BED5A4|nr:DUF2085 domain-containing protein [Clostridium sp. CX1]MCT8977078.1 DUF2085 domain-containing protein [Clostridium sp. CX1]
MKKSKLPNYILSRLHHIGKKPLCNLKAHRAPIIFGFCFPLCWRCTSLIIGIITGNIIQHQYYYNKGLQWIGIVSILPLAIDGYLQYVLEVESTNLRRIITGLLTGFGLSYL